MKRIALVVCLVMMATSLSGCYQSDVNSFVGGAMRGIERDNLRRQQEDAVFEARARESIRQGHNDFMIDRQMFETRRMNMMAHQFKPMTMHEPSY